MSKLFKPVLYKFIEFIDQETNTKIGYTDCHEVSILRLLHIIFCDVDDNNEYYLNVDKMKKYATEELCNFFTENNYIKLYLEEDYYSTTEALNNLRSDWCVFLNKREKFCYGNSNKYELHATDYNIEQFFRTFFPTIKLPEQKLFRNYDKEYFEYYKLIFFNIFNAFNIDSKQLKCDVTHVSKIINHTILPYSMILQQSYIEDEVCLIETEIKIYIDDDYVYRWDLYTFTNYSEGYILNRLTGHSELHCANDEKEWKFD